jgi:hypothetical protein
MNRKRSDQCPRVFASQLKEMIDFADTNEDFALAAWLSQALDRLMGAHIKP